MRYEDIKKDLIICAENVNRVREEDVKRPRLDFMEIVVIDDPEDAIHVTKDMIKEWGITEEQLFKDAIASIVPEMKIDHGDVYDSLGVSNKQVFYGTGVIFNSREAIEEVKRILGGSFYISLLDTNAVECVKKSETLLPIFQEVNENIFKKNERCVTGSVYEYDAEKDEFRVTEKVEVPKKKSIFAKLFKQ